MLIHINGKFTMKKLTSFLLQCFVLSRLSLSISRCKPKYEADLQASYHHSVYIYATTQRIMGCIYTCTCMQRDTKCNMLSFKLDENANNSFCIQKHIFFGYITDFLQISFLVFQMIGLCFLVAAPPTFSHWYRKTENKRERTQ